MRSIPYLWSDAWLLLSVLLAAAPDGASLEGIISVGDGINHAIFSFHEIDGGLARLVAGGFVRLKRDRVFPTDDAIGLYARVSGGGGSLLTHLEAIRRKIGAPAWSASHDPTRADPAWSLRTLSQEDLVQAHTTYKRQFAAALRNLEKQGR